MELPFPRELDEWNTKDIDFWADYPIHSGRGTAVKCRCDIIWQRGITPYPIAKNIDIFEAFMQQASDDPGMTAQAQRGSGIGHLVPLQFQVTAVKRV